MIGLGGSGGGGGGPKGPAPHVSTNDLEGCWWYAAPLCGLQACVKMEATGPDSLKEYGMFFFSGLPVPVGETRQRIPGTNHFKDDCDVIKYENSKKGCNGIIMQCKIG